MYSLVKHCNAKADWNPSNSGDASFRDEIFKRIDRLNFLSSFSSSKSGSGQTLITLSNKGNSLRSDIISKVAFSLLHHQPLVDAFADLVQTSKD